MLTKTLLYCTKQKPYLIKQDDEFDITKDSYDHRILWDKMPICNGKIIGECEFVVEKINVVENTDYAVADMQTKTLSETQLLERSCLSQEELYVYLDRGGIVEDYGYAIHIKNLTIYDKPKELSDYYNYVGCKGDINNYHFIEKAPQNMMTAYELHSELGYSGTYNRWFEKKILISIRPEWLCKILNGEKTIEIRRKVLKEMV